MCYLIRHICTGCSRTHDLLEHDPSAKQPELLWSRICSGKHEIREVYDGLATCLFCYEKEYKALEAIFKAKEKREVERARGKRVVTEGQIEVLKEGMRMEFGMEIGILREEFSSYGG